MKKLSTFLLLLAVAGVASAKLPPPSDEAKAKAAQAKDKAAWSDKVAAWQLCQAQDKVAAQYKKGKGDKNLPASSCQNPGPYVPAAAAPVATPAAAATSASASAVPAAKPAASASAPAVQVAAKPGAAPAAGAAKK
jgi:hypothetical protein